MKPLIFSCLLGLGSMTMQAQERTFHIPEVTVTAQRRMKDIGVQQTRLDSVILKENIALSMADVLTYNSPLFVKNYGRATLSTVSFRGTSPSHTQVTWNGMKINNPMLGMVDFSTIPSYFIDDAVLLHGTSSVHETGGGLGGAIKLNTSPARQHGLGLQYVQGIGSFRTFDEFLRLLYGNAHWQVSTRVVLASSPNDYTYRNHDKKENIYDANRHIVGQYYPKERNRSGAYRDFHLLHEMYYDTLHGDKMGLNVWVSALNRELPVLTTDYGNVLDFLNRQREHTSRVVYSWHHYAEQWKLAANVGYAGTWLAYDYQRDPGNGTMEAMTCSRSNIHTGYAKVDADWSPSSKWLVTATVSAYQHFVRSSDKNVIMQDGQKAIVGYDKARMELSSSLSVKWKPVERVGLSAILRGEQSGSRTASPIPALFADWLVSERGSVIIKSSISRNHRFPSLNDMYFLPGGNPDLRNEHGFSYDVAVSSVVSRSDGCRLDGALSWFDSYIDDWILWLPTTKGFFSPRNVRKVHAFGLEFKANAQLNWQSDWHFNVSTTGAWTPSINKGEAQTAADKSMGKQLPYVPRWSVTAMARLQWRRWTLLYKWCHYSERYTMSSNSLTLTGHLPAYFMSDISLERNISCRMADMSFKCAVSNLFNEEYLSVLSRPMPGIHAGFFVSVTPRFRR